MQNSNIEKEINKVKQAADFHKEELEEELNILTAKAEHAITTALIVGGSLALSYFLAKKLFGSKPKRKKTKAKKARKPLSHEEEVEEEESTPSYAQDLMGRIGETLVNQAAAILLDLAKEKLIEFLHSQQKNSEQGDTSKDN